MKLFKTLGLIVLVLISIIGAVAGSKELSPLGWHLYGEIQNTKGVAISGYDPVAYFGGQAARGNPAMAFTWKGAQWQFSSEANRTLFEKNPEKYAPQFGGHCAYAVSKGFTAKCDSEAFLIQDGKLYLFNDTSMRANWVKELPEGAFVKAQTNWNSR